MAGWWFFALGLAFAAGFALGGGWVWGVAAVGLLIALMVLRRHRYLLGSVRVLRAHLRRHGGSAANLRIRWVRIVDIAGLDARRRRQSDCTFDAIGGVPLTVLARLARRRLVAIDDGRQLTLWQRRLSRYHEVAQLRPHTLRVQHEDRDLLRQSRSFLAEWAHEPIREFSPYSVIADFGNRRTVSFQVHYGPTAPRRGPGVRGSGVR
ncbi:hypothetical protein GTZ89_20700 [Streptomyces sp. SID8382]|uniref:hypothetical protein n=1 Tax=Streptomyces malaysiensis TaxID=92644 RepID=UPI000C2B60EF|nr:MULTISPECIES: hypothetical protein [unclassified Streptomyces]AUA16850.1 hypothetical protein CFP59_09042 [Streptomyces sp. M56]MYX58017.1 hypothetical protein [Streptomyces sp. SID8382]